MADSSKKSNFLEPKVFRLLVLDKQQSKIFIFMTWNNICSHVCVHLMTI